MATITYNGKTIATLSAGQTATLLCKGDSVKMLSDIVVKNEESVGIPDGYVKPNGTLNVTANGNHNVADKEFVQVDVPPVPIEVSTEAEMNELLTNGTVGAVYKYTGETGTYENGELYVIEVAE